MNKTMKIYPRAMSNKYGNISFQLLLDWNIKPNVKKHRASKTLVTALNPSISITSK